MAQNNNRNDKEDFDIITQGREVVLTDKPATVRKYNGHIIAVKDRKKGILSGEVRYNGGNKHSYHMNVEGEERTLFYSNLERFFENSDDPRLFLPHPKRSQE